MTCGTAPSEGRLNAFQRVMLQWSELHPYNAIHTYQLAGPLNLPALQQAIQDALAFNGLGVADINLDGVSYRHRPHDAQSPVEIELVAGDEPPEERLAAHLAREVNRPFERPRCRPFRFSVVDAGPASHFVSLIYDHWVADSIGARLIMRHVLGRYLGLDISENNEPLHLYPGTYREVFSRRLRGPRLALRVLRSMGGWLRRRPAWRVAYASAAQMAVGYATYRVQPGTVQKVRQFARNNNASVNDVFLAVLGRAMIPFLPKRIARGSGRDLAMGSIVDMRPDAERDLTETLGTFLGYYVVRASGDHRVGLDQLTRQVAAATRVRKRQRSYLDGAVSLRVASAIWPHLKPESRPQFARRALPMTAGISNVYLRNTWIERQGAGRILDFRRAVSSGPALPLVVSPTTIGEQMNVTVSYRLTGFSQAKVDGIMQSFVEQLETLDDHRTLHRSKRSLAPSAHVAAEPTAKVKIAARTAMPQPANS
jgi:hypothetical protein